MRTTPSAPVEASSDQTTHNINMYRRRIAGIKYVKAVCTCGEYESKETVSEMEAVIAGRDHVRSKNKVER